jgi:hypothetical protein
MHAPAYGFAPPCPPQKGGKLIVQVEKKHFCRHSSMEDYTRAIKFLFTHTILHRAIKFDKPYF